MITRDSWPRIKEIFQSAQELKPEERSDFLDRACGDDKSLREEVEALLVADDSNEDFLSDPAYELIAGIIVPEETEFSADHKIGPYTIKCSLGSGGMGQIYLAEDTRLHRNVALKFISQQFANDPGRVRRFEQEALAASALNHPNICVIHELGTTESGRHFIAMEHIQGITLRDQLSRGPLPVKQSLNIAIQVATALSSAHASRIVHRDIKPENIMLRPDGYVKVLDFGLAKLTEALPIPEAPLLGSKNVGSEAGTLMGTVKYMSPEQLRETKVDERSDIWSLGVVLYEMLTGATPFEAPKPSETIAAIRSVQPASLQFPEHVTGPLRAVITRALDKERDRRYQTISKLAADLKREQAKLQGQTTIDLGSAYPFTGDEQLTQKIEPSGIFTRIKTQALLTTDFLLTEIRSHKGAALFTGVSGVLVFLLLVPNLARFISSIVNRPGPVLTTIEMKPVTNEGNSICTTISPDGKLIAYAEEKDGKQRIVVTNTATYASDIAVPLEDVQYVGLSFTRENGYLFFTRKENGTGILYRQALPHSPPVKIKDGVDSPISFSPQEDRFAFIRLDGKGVYSLVLANVDGSNEQVISTRTGRNKFSTDGLAWSPDGSLIVCATRSWTENGYKVNLMGFDLTSGSEQPLSPESWFAILQISWQEDMSSIVISARDQPTDPVQLWRVNYPAGTRHKITNDLAGYWGASVSGQNIVTVKSEWQWELFIVNAADNYELHSSILSGAGLIYGIAWAGNGQIVYTSMAQGKLNISRINDDGSNQVQLTMNAGNNYTPETSADGRFVVFASDRGTGKFNIWRMNTDGGDLKQLTFSDGNFYPSISPDNQWVVYDNQSSTTKDVWRVPLDGGPPTKIAEKYRMPAYSPDSRRIAARYDLSSGTRDVAIFSGDGEPLRQVQIPVIEWQRVRWLNDHTLSYVKSVNGAANIWSYDLNTGSTVQLTNFNRDQIFAYAWSPDNKKLACQLGSGIANVVVIKSGR
jgi:serine/threonine protein kinase/Tol biopolymer transport system component